MALPQNTTTVLLQKTVTFSFGTSEKQVEWERKTVTREKFIQVMLTHKEGPKSGTSLVPAIFSGKRRKKADAVSIDMMAFDFDRGTSVEEIEGKVRELGLGAIIHTTHSHNSTETLVDENTYLKWLFQNPAGGAMEYMLSSGYSIDIAASASRGEDRLVGGRRIIILRHDPLPKSRAIFFLKEPWRREAYGSLVEAEEGWRAWCRAVGARIGAPYDESCLDLSRLFFMPRHRAGGDFLAKWVEGADLDPTDVSTFPPLAEESPGAPGAPGRGSKRAAPKYVLESGVAVDLRRWAGLHDNQFQIADALAARSPEVLVGYVADKTKVHVVCPFRHEHTKQDIDGATFVVNARDSITEKGGFVVHCRHWHCESRDRLEFLHQWLSDGTLSVDDLPGYADALVVTSDPDVDFRDTPTPSPAGDEPADDDEMAMFLSAAARIDRGESPDEIIAQLASRFLEGKDLGAMSADEEMEALLGLAQVVSGDKGAVDTSRGVAGTLLKQQTFAAEAQARVAEKADREARRAAEKAAERAAKEAEKETARVTARAAKEAERAAKEKAKAESAAKAQALQNEWKRITKDKPPEWVDEMNRSYFVLNEAGKSFVCCERYDPELGRFRLERSSFADFRDLYCNDKVMVGYTDKGQKIFAPKGKAWLESEHRRTYKEGLCFLPQGQAPVGVYNLWRGFGAVPAKGDWSLLRRHLIDNLCSGNQEHARYFIRWLAYAVQYPDRPGQVAIVLKGGRGTGKGVCATWIGRLFGRHFVHASNPDTVTGRFNEHLRECVMLFADEAFFAGNKSHEGVLKALVTEHTLHIEGKFKSGIQSRNYTHLIMASNEDWVVPAGADERRFFVPEVGAKVQQNSAYFQAITNQMENGGLEAMLFDLLHLDLDGFDVRSVPQSTALSVQKMESMGCVESWWQEQLQFGECPEAADTEDWENTSSDFPVKAKTIDLYAHYVNWAKEHRIYRPKKIARFGTMMKELCPEINRWRGPEEEMTGKRPRYLQFPGLGKCREAFEKYLGAPIKWSA